ncbi:MAG: hypothetical protein QN183_13845 [Armatimonadota bacterium]|nr:hypothetical protein [Armatimonadota bacterium]
MRRLVTVTVGRLQRGEVYDFPRGVWAAIARSAGRPLESFSVDVDEAARRMLDRRRKEE